MVIANAFSRRPQHSMAMFTTTIVLVVLVVSLCLALRTPCSFDVGTTEGEPLVAIASMAPNGPASSVGISIGDTIVGTQEHGRLDNLIVQHGRQRLLLAPGLMTPTPLDYMVAALSICLLVLGTSVLKKSADHQTANAFWRMTVLAAAALGLVPAGIHGVSWILILHFVVLRLFGPSLLEFALVFPSAARSPLDRLGRWRALIWLPPLLCLPLYFLILPSPALLVIVADGLLTGYIVTSCLRFLWLATCVCSIHERAQVHYLMIGLVGGLLPSVLFTVLPMILIGRTIVPSNITLLGLMLLPASTIVAIVREEFFGITYLMRRRTLHIWLRVMSLVGMTAVAMFISIVVSKHWQWPPPVMTAGTSVFTALGFITLWPRLLHCAERLVLRDVYAMPDTVMQLSRELRDKEPHAAGPFVVMQLSNLLDLTDALLLTPNSRWEYLHPGTRPSVVGQETVLQHANNLFGAYRRAEPFVELVNNKSVFFLPVWGGSDLLAILCLGPKRRGDCYTARDHNLLGAIIREMALLFCMQHLHQHRKVQAAMHQETLPAILYEQIQGADKACAGMRVQLSPREMEVFSYLRDGLSNKEIAKLLERDVKTVEKHVAHIFAN